VWGRGEVLTESLELILVVGCDVGIADVAVGEHLIQALDTRDRVGG
jgi:hypothetical protein